LGEVDANRPSTFSFFHVASRARVPAAGFQLSQALDALHYRPIAINDRNIHTRSRSLLSAMTNVLIKKRLPIFYFVILLLVVFRDVK